MKKKDFIKILKKYRLGEASEHEIQIVEEWYEAMSDQHGDASIEEPGLEERYLSTIMKHVSKTSEQAMQPSRIRSRKYVIGIAASVLILIASQFLVTNKTSELQDPVPDKKHELISWSHIINNNEAVQQYTLPDGSRVALEPHSSIKFSTLFNVSVREVDLEGEGFFEVTKSKNKPFLVHTHEVTTKVLGTSFTVRAFQQDKKVTVSVKTGVVSVYTKQEGAPGTKEEIILTPNQEMVYDKAQKVVARRLVDVPQPVISVKEMESMRFEDAPLKEIFEAIEKIYGVDVVYDEELFDSCTLTTSVTGGGLYNRLDIIASAIGAKYELDENRIVIKGAGCN